MRYYWPVKDPDAVLDYSVDWSNWLGDDTISTVTWEVPTGIKKENQSNTTTVATVWLSGGTAGNTYDITCRITTAGGRTDDRTVRLKVSSL